MWEDELRETAKLYEEGDRAAQKRRAVWQRYAAETILPTLERAAKTLKEGGLAATEVERYVFGGHLESVQLQIAGRDTGVVLSADFAERKKASHRLVFEVGATLGYSLGVSGRVRRWYIEHWFDNLGEHHPAPAYQELFEDASALTVQVLERHVLDFVKSSLATSYCAPHEDGMRATDWVIGFVAADENANKNG